MRAFKRGAEMQRIQFHVGKQLPPKKYGKKRKSMWRNETQARRLIALRKAAREALGSQERFTKNIRLTLRVYVGSDGPVSGDRDNIGDLDNFISGVCDGLMRAHENTGKLHPQFGRRENRAVHPREWDALSDDSKVVKIDAKKFFGPGDHWYTVALKGK